MTLGEVDPREPGTRDRPLDTGLLSRRADRGSRWYDAEHANLDRGPGTRLLSDGRIATVRDGDIAVDLGDTTVAVTEADGTGRHEVAGFAASSGVAFSASVCPG